MLLKGHVSGRCAWLAKIRLTPSTRLRNAGPLKTPLGSWLIRYKRPILPKADLRTNIQQSRRTVLTDAVPSVLVPPLVFIGLVLALWTYKCFMMVLFQDKIIYMPYVPPFTRGEKIEDYALHCRPVEWHEKRIRSLDGTKISLCTGCMPHDTATERQVTVCYFHGNGGSIPPRLPALSQMLKLLHAKEAGDVQYTLVALSYRGYWTSSGRASQSGIELDAQALLKYVTEEMTSPGQTAELILWGQSIGAGVASTAAAKFLSKSAEHNRRAQLRGLVMETPFTSIKSMLSALYPQMWLPYRYLHPFLWNHWDSEKALRSLARIEHRPAVLLMPATRDEIVPPGEVAKLEQLCKDLHLAYQKIDVKGALHNEAASRREGQEGVVAFVRQVVR
ncbi:hypothetical protein LTR37_007776 [Vermiconidia calcicola]|uniref:Uncharacterized protein n=1 Tax=Vermiconidia calcicola TaxID=1690605 RepID=A0ACC3NCW6_9PEZI|nr:hypothetical protein LTR37_007776 [Vermiconidia calcicola]